MIRFNVIGQHIERCDDTVIAGGSIDYLEAKFMFSKEWSGREKTALFQSGNEKYEVLLDENDMITADKHLNLDEGIWKLNVIGTGAGRITTDVVSFVVAKNGISEGNVLPEVSLSYAEQILKKVNEAVEAAKYMKELADNAYKGEKGEQGPKGDPGDSPVITSSKVGITTTISITVGENEPVVLEIKDGEVNIVDNLLSTASNMGLSANMGRVMNEKIDTRTTTSRGILTAGDTSITIYDERIVEGCAIQPFTSIDGVNPTSKYAEVGSVTYTFDAQESDMEVGVMVYV